MTDTEFREAAAMYPDIVNAIAFTEAIFCVPPQHSSESAFDLCVRAGLGPDKIIANIVEISSETLDSDSLEDLACRDRAVLQMRLPNYRRYIAGKLGCV